MPEARRARIVTFYSYKGGTGRSMALANVAWILAAYGKRVLVVDWDLEAPGLHRYLHPFLEDKELKLSDGVIDMVMKYSAEAVRPGDEDENWYEPFANIRRYASSLNYQFPSGVIDFVPSGRQDTDYATRVNSFNWENFYERLDGGLFLEAAKRSMACYDYVLIDSRTGVSDTSGICTVQMPDTLVICFTPNSQSIEGAGAVAESAHAQRMRPDGTPGLLIYPLMTRVMQGERDRVALAREAARRRFDGLLWHVPANLREAYWGQVFVPHQDFYSFEEVLAVFGDQPGHTNTMLAAMETLAGYVARPREEAEQTTALPAPMKLPPMDEPERKRLLSQFVRTASPVVAPEVEKAVARKEKAPAMGKASAPVKPGEGQYWFYLSYARIDNDNGWVDRLFADLGLLVTMITGDPAAIGFADLDKTASAQWSEGEAEALASTRTFVPLLSKAYFASEFCGREFELFRRRQASANSIVNAMLPLLAEPMKYDDLPEVLQGLQYLGEDFPPEYAQTGLRQMMTLRRHRDNYKIFLDRFAWRLVALARENRVPRGRSASLLEGVPSSFAEAAKESPADTVLFAIEGLFENREKHRAMAFEAAWQRKLTVRLVPAGPDLAESVRQAEERNQPLIIIVDGEFSAEQQSVRAPLVEVIVVTDLAEEQMRPAGAYVTQAQLPEAIGRAIDSLRLRIIRSSTSGTIPKLA